jgi:ribosomal protein S18 acetylase RimI-like enzyme
MRLLECIERGSTLRNQYVDIIIKKVNFVTEIQIRKVEEKDFLRIIDFTNNCAPIPKERNSIYHCLTRFFANTCFVAERQGNIIGHILGWISQVDDKIAYVHNVCIMPEGRRHKIATKLYDRFIKAVKEIGCDQIFLIANAMNDVSINFHRSLGFKPTIEGEKIIINGVETIKDYNGPGEHMVLMRKDLS